MKKVSVFFGLFLVANLLVAQVASVTIQEAKSIFGAKNVFGPQEIEKALGIKIDSMLVPPIPFSKKTLGKAKAMDMFLILKMPLSVNALNNLLKGLVDKEAKLFYHYNLRDGKFKRSAWYTDMDWFTKSDSDKPYWTLDSKNLLRNSLNKNYIQQTGRIYDCLMNKIFVGDTIPQIYREALAQWDSIRPIIKKMMAGTNNCELQCDSLLDISKINLLCRPSPFDIIYDLVVIFKITKKRIFTGVKILTNVRDKDGLRVSVGYFDDKGIAIDAMATEESDEETGGLFIQKL